MDYNEYIEPNSVEPNTEDTKGIISVACGISGAILNVISLCCCIGYIGIPLSIISLVTAFISRAENGNKFTKYGLTGLISTIVGYAILLIGIILAFIFGFALGIAEATTSV